MSLQWLVLSVKLLTRPPGRVFSLSRPLSRLTSCDHPAPNPMAPPAAAPFKSLQDFYPYYKQEHCKTGTRALHFVGTSLFLVQAAAAGYTRNANLLLSGVVSAYGCAWVGHFFVEHNKPATFKHPLYSLMSDFIMYFNILTGKESLIGT